MIRNCRFALLLATAALVAACSHTDTRAPAAPTATPASTAPRAPATTTSLDSDATSLAALDRAIASPIRSAANRDRDAARHPRETLAFFGIRSNMTVLEVWPGGSGWYAEILAPLLHDHGHYIAAEHDPASSAFAADAVSHLRARFDADPDHFSSASIVALQTPAALTPVPAGSVDMALTFRNLHNWLMRDDAETMLAALYKALKPGGILGIVDHRADPMATPDPKAHLGYVNEHEAIALAERAGFEFLGSAEINANPRDTRDYEQGVWTLPPTYRLGDKDRDRYAAIGESDRFTLRFRKPLNAR